MTASCQGTDPGGHMGRGVVYQTPLGPLIIRPNCPPGLFADLQFDSGLGHFARYSSIITRLASFEAITSREGGRVTVALAHSRVIVAYLACWYPHPEDRWSALGNSLYEMGALEVSRTYRGMQVARRMVEVTLEDGFFEDKIAFMQGFSWHWDLEGTGMTAAEYRKMMIRFGNALGFHEVHTNEPSLALRPENVMMVRVGSRVSAEDQKRFRYLRFGIRYPDPPRDNDRRSDLP